MLVRFRPTILPTILVYLSGLICAFAGPYVVNGFTLGEQIPQTGSDYSAYKCVPSETFADYIWCSRAQQKNTSAGKSTLSTGIIHSETGTAIYLMADLAPVLLNKRTIEKEIVQLSEEMKEQPSQIEWSSGGKGITTVIVLWGRIDLHKVAIKNRFKNITLHNIIEAAGTRPELLFDPLGDPVTSVKAGLPVYRIAGTAGYFYFASFDENGLGRRHDVAADLAEPAILRYEPKLRSVFEKESNQANKDAGLWPDLATAARNLSLATSPEIANEQLDKLYKQYPLTKLRSHIWPYLPLSTTDYLSRGFHWMISTYGQHTTFPDIRADIQKFLAKHPSEPFSEFLYYTIGRYEDALKADPNSPINAIVRYAIGHRIMFALLRDTANAVKISFPDSDGSLYPDAKPVTETLIFLNKHPERYGNKLLSEIVQNFAAQAEAARPWFEAVLHDDSSVHRDDAAYMLGWLAFHKGEFMSALSYVAQVMEIGGDYEDGAVTLADRILSRYPARQQATIVGSDPAFSKHSALWLVAAKGAYREFDFDTAIEAAEQGLKASKISPDQLPATTDPVRIKEEIEKHLPEQILGNTNFVEHVLLELPYVVEPSKEMVQYSKYLRSLGSENPDVVARNAKAIIIKYSFLVDRPEHPDNVQQSPRPEHKDLRQAVHLIDMTLKSVPQNSEYAALREWLHYRKVRILVRFAPGKVPDAVAAMEGECPKSRLMNNALAEQLYAEGFLMQDIPAAEKTFQKLLKAFPNGNAVDNAYTWMAISYRCAKQLDKARKTNLDIIRLFFLTRHARYAAERMAHPNDCGRDETY
jgi:tetratricopeptide (TPR) repeat protein